MGGKGDQGRKEEEGEEGENEGEEERNRRREEVWRRGGAPLASGAGGHLGEEAWVWGGTVDQAPQSTLVGGRELPPPGSLLWERSFLSPSDVGAERGPVARESFQAKSLVSVVGNGAGRP